MNTLAGPLLLLDFRAAWCVQCDVQRELLERLIAASGGEVEVEHIDIDDAPHRARAFGVSEVPTLVLCRGGETLGRLVGAQPYEHLAALVKAGSESKTLQENNAL